MAESQLRKGSIELVVLSVLQRSPTYGAHLRSLLYTDYGLDVSSGTLYPLLSRLRKARLLDIEWEPSPSGPPRKIYSVNDKGRQQRAQLAHEFRQLVRVIEQLE